MCATAHGNVNSSKVVEALELELPALVTTHRMCIRLIKTTNVLDHTCCPTAVKALASHMKIIRKCSLLVRSSLVRIMTQCAC